MIFNPHFTQSLDDVSAKPIEQVKPRSQIKHNLKKIEVLHTGITGSVQVYRGFETAWGFMPARALIPYQWHASVINFWLNLNGTFHILNALSSIGLLSNVHATLRHVRQLTKTRDLLRFDAAMHVLRCMGSLFENLAGTFVGIEGLKWADKFEAANYQMLSNAMKTLTATAATFLTIGTLLSITDVVIHARKWKKTDEYYKDFIDHSGYRQDGCYTDNCYNVFLKYLEKRSPKQFKQNFLVSGKLLKAKLLVMESDIEKRPNNYDQLNSILSKLKNRLESSKTTYTVSLISDVSSLLSKALIISGLFQPLGFFLLGIFTLGRFTVFIQRKFSAYAFENQIGLILRPDSKSPNPKMDLKNRVKDFAIWFFGFHKYIPMPKISLFRFGRTKGPLLPVTINDHCDTTVSF